MESSAPAADEDTRNVTRGAGAGGGKATGLASRDGGGPGSSTRSDRNHLGLRVRRPRTLRSEQSAVWNEEPLARCEAGHERDRA